MARAADIGIEGIPVGLAERGQGVRGAGRIAAFCGEHQAPAGRGEAVLMSSVRTLRKHDGIVARRGLAASGLRSTRASPSAPSWHAPGILFRTNRPLTTFAGFALETCRRAGRPGLEFVSQTLRAFANPRLPRPLLLAPR